MKTVHHASLSRKRFTPFFIDMNCMPKVSFLFDVPAPVCGFNAHANKNKASFGHEKRLFLQKNRHFFAKEPTFFHEKAARACLIRILGTHHHLSGTNRTKLRMLRAKDVVKNEFKII